MDVDWSSPHRLHTDVVLGDLWQSDIDSMLEAARVAWDHGTFLPSLKDTMDVLRSASGTIQAQQVSAEARQAMVEIALFLVQPIEQQRMLIRGHSETLRHSFVSGGAHLRLPDLPPGVGAAARQGDGNRSGEVQGVNPGGALFDAAQAHGKL